MRKDAYHKPLPRSMVSASFRRDGRSWIAWAALLLALGLLLSPGNGRSEDEAADKVGSQVDRSVLLAAAQEAFKEGRFREAAGLYSRILKDHGPCPECHSGRGEALEMLNDDRKAVEDFKEAIRGDHSDYRSMEHLAGMYERQGKPVSEAIEWYKRALELDPRADRKQDLAAWLAMLESRLRSEEESAVGCWHLGNEKARKGDAEGAEASYTKALKLNPRMFQAYYSRGKIRLENGEVAPALADFEQLVRMVPEFAQGFLCRGLAYEQAGKVNKARRDLERATSLDPRDPAAWYHKARLLEGTDDAEALLELYQTAMKLRPSRELAALIKAKIAGIQPVQASKKREAPRPGADPSSELW